jgi:hypothetical protein
VCVPSNVRVGASRASMIYGACTRLHGVFRAHKLAACIACPHLLLACPHLQLSVQPEEAWESLFRMGGELEFRQEEGGGARMEASFRRGGGGARRRRRRRTRKKLLVGQECGIRYR